MKTVSIVAITVAATAFATAAFGNSGTLLPLNQYQAGTEVTNNTNVLNRGFEAVTAGTPDVWANVGGSPGVAAPIGPNVTPSVHQTKAANFPGTNSVQRSIWEQPVTVAANTNYVLSGYLWNYSTTSLDTVAIEARTFPTMPLNASFLGNVALTPGSNPSAADGVFGYQTINTGGNTSIAIQALFNFNSPSGGSQAGSIAQIDNISLTLATEFVPPSLVPEPTSLTLLAGFGLAALRRSRR